MTLTLARAEGNVIRIGMSTWQGRATGYSVSAYLLRGVLVDSGFVRVRDELLRATTDLAPRGVVITHWHEDHSGNAPALAARGVPMLMHSACERTLRARSEVRAYRRIVWGRPAALRDPLVSFDPSPLRVIEAPGHTADHLVVYDEERGILASGDLFLGVKVRVAHHAERPRTLVRTLRAMAALRPRVLLDAHRGVLHDAAALLLAKAAWLEDTIGSIMTLAGGGVPEREIQRRVLGPEALVGYVSFGEYSGRALVQAVLSESDEPA